MKSFEERSYKYGAGIAIIVLTYFMHNIDVEMKRVNTTMPVIEYKIDQLHKSVKEVSVISHENKERILILEQVSGAKKNGIFVQKDRSTYLFTNQLYTNNSNPQYSLNF